MKVKILFIFALIFNSIILSAQTSEIKNSCPQVNLENLNDRQKKAITEAVNDVCEIFKSEEFKQMITSKTWLRSCDKVDGKPDELSGEEVYKTILNAIAKFTIKAKKPFFAVALTNRCKGTIKIMPSRIENWYSGQLLTKSNLINTIAHEIMHIISEEFNDRGHGSEECPDFKLVSYSVGDITELIWLCTHKQ